MKFSDIIGHQYIKNHLTQSADEQRIPHAQLFVGPEGSGTLPMAIAYAQYLICNNSNGENTGENVACNIKINKLQHPDLHFIFPNNKVKESDKEPYSEMFTEQWVEFVTEYPYGNLSDWQNFLGVGNKQTIINVRDAASILKKLSLKSYEGGYKVMIIWMPEKMNAEASNKILKILEEPPQQTVFILVSENEKALLQTITSRCQIIRFNSLSENEITEALLKQNKCDANEATLIAKQAHGNYNKALKALNNTESDLPFDEWFVSWVRSAFLAKTKAKVVADLILWSDDLAAIGREKQKLFLEYCLELFRQAFMLNYNVSELVYIHPKAGNFKLEKFAPFVHENNIFEIYKEVSDAIYHIERNGNPKLIFTDLSIKLTRLIHVKSSPIEEKQ